MRKILVSKRRGIGDAVLMTPAIEVLQRNFPEAAITVLTTKAAAAIFTAQPGVARVWAFEDRSLLGWIWQIATERFDLYFDFNSTGQTRWLARLAFARKVVSHRHDPQTWKRYRERPNAIDWDIYALRENLPNLSVPPRELQRPKFFLFREELAAAQAFWEEHGVRNNSVVVLGTGATRETKRWPAAHYARFVSLLKQRLSTSIALLIGPDEKDKQFANSVIEEINQLRIPFGPGSAFIVEQVKNLRTYAALVAKAQAYVGNDSGPKHIAAAVGTPTLTFFGPEDPVEWHPYQKNDHPYLFQAGLPCRREDNGRWCGIAVCTKEKHRCMTGLSPEDAFRAFLGLKRHPLIHDLPMV